MGVEGSGVGEPEGGGQVPGGEVSGVDGSVPSVNEDLIWRARAARAEAQVEELTARVQEIEGELEMTRREAGRTDQRRTLELELALAEAVDIETAALVGESVLGQMEEPDVHAAVAQMRRTKPFLFRAKKAPSALSARVSTVGASTILDELADEARDSGDRGALLKYLRARRSN